MMSTWVEGARQKCDYFVLKCMLCFKESSYLKALFFSFCNTYLAIDYWIAPYLYIQRNKSDVDALFEEFVSFPFDEEGESRLIYDKHKSNGRPEINFEAFYKELDILLEEFGKAAEERRHSQTAHLPVAVSVPNLRLKVNSTHC